VLRLVHLEVLLREGDLVRACPFHGVGNGAQRIDLRDGVSEPPRARLREPLLPRARVCDAVLAEA
jgi:hypothetical protein